MHICEILARNARMYPHNEALVELVSTSQSRYAVTWREFNRQVNALANALIGLGVKKNDKVLHLMLNSIDWLIVYFAIAKTGAWVVPLSYRYTTKDIIHCAEISEAKTMFFDQAFAEKVDAARYALPYLKNYVVKGTKTFPFAQKLSTVISASDSQPPSIELDDDDVCGLYFTSGTTGTPKPLMLTHRNMLCSAITNCVNDNKQHEDNFIFISPLYHTGSKMRWLGNMIVGSKGTMLNGFTPIDLVNCVANERGTILMLLVPWALDILQAVEEGNINLDKYDLSCLRLVTLGAQPIPVKLVREWKKLFATVDLDIGYGLSEATGVGCLHLGTKNWQKGSQIGDIKGAIIGKPGFNWEAQIVDSKSKMLGPNLVGELIVRGDGIMKGYYKNPQKTSEAIKNGWLYTGDLAIKDPEGFFYLVDRKKDVVISGGENIYPVEIEDVLHSHPGVRDVAVIGFPDDRLGEIVVAIVDVKPGVTVSTQDLLTFANNNLPRYKRPKKIIFDEVPRNPTGKLLKTKLREKYCGSNTFV